MRADNKGEGGVLSLASLALRTGHAAPRRRRMIWIMALVGLALFYGDALITPSVSVLSAVEGLVGRDRTPFDHASSCRSRPSFSSLLFLLQSRGTRSVGAPLRPDHDPVVRRSSASSACCRSSSARRSCSRLSPIYAIDLDRRPAVDHVRRAGLDRALRHGRRGALRRHGPFRQRPDPHRVDRRHASASCSTISAKARCC